jgi:hypothetical protein
MTTVAEVAEWLGISGRRVKELRAEGVLPGSAGDEYDLKACVQAYCRRIRPAAGKAAAGGSDSAEELDANRARESRLRGDKLELINAQLRAELVPADEMETVMGQAFDAVRGKVLALPSRAAPLILGCKTALEIQERLTELVHDACGDLASADAVATVKDRTRRRAGRGAGGGEDAEEASTAA